MEEKCMEKVCQKYLIIYIIQKYFLDLHSRAQSPLLFVLLPHSRNKQKTKTKKTHCSLMDNNSNFALFVVSGYSNHSSSSIVAIVFIWNALMTAKNNALAKVNN
jgi:hypothetical protein